VTLGCGGEFAE